MQGYDLANRKVVSAAEDSNYPSLLVAILSLQQPSPFCHPERSEGSAVLRTFMEMFSSDFATKSPKLTSRHVPGDAPPASR